ncbi:hypothetical protein F4808DRAFT_425483 [Astrocystis sublimbata]|nr:hypothetical protein F4808DRAFT_425483 [Astrocystis sublimbata]
MKSFVTNVAFSALSLPLSALQGPEAHAQHLHARTLMVIPNMRDDAPRQGPKEPYQKLALPGRWAGHHRVYSGQYKRPRN